MNFRLFFPVKVSFAVFDLRFLSSSEILYFLLGFGSNFLACRSALDILFELPIFLLVSSDNGPKHVHLSGNFLFNHLSSSMTSNLLKTLSSHSRARKELLKVLLTFITSGSPFSSRNFLTCVELVK